MSLFYIHICKNKTTVHKLKYFSPEDGASNHPKFHIEQDLDNHDNPESEKEISEYDVMFRIIKSKNGTILDLNTDAISFVMKNNELPFKLLSDGINIKGYYFDEKKRRFILWLRFFV